VNQPAWHEQNYEPVLEQLMMGFVLERPCKSHVWPYFAHAMLPALKSAIYQKIAFQIGENRSLEIFEELKDFSNE